MRKVTRQVAFEPTGWTPERARKVGELFDGLAADWATRLGEGRSDALHDALDRGGPYRTDALCVELGSGVGLFTPDLIERGRFDNVVAVDLSLEMLRRAPAGTPRLQADASRLPFADGTVATAVLVNMLLFPVELDRVLDRRDGTLVWANTFGPATPIHLSAEDVLRAMPGAGDAWDGVHAEAGWGTWAVLRRAGRPS